MNKNPYQWSFSAEFAIIMAFIVYVVLAALSLLPCLGAGATCSM